MNLDAGSLDVQSEPELKKLLDLWPALNAATKEETLETAERSNTMRELWEQLEQQERVKLVRHAQRLLDEYPDVLDEMSRCPCQLGCTVAPIKSRQKREEPAETLDTSGAGA